MSMKILSHLFVLLGLSHWYILGSDLKRERHIDRGKGNPDYAHSQGDGRLCLDQEIADIINCPVNILNNNIVNKWRDQAKIYIDEINLKIKTSDKYQRGQFETERVLILRNLYKTRVWIEAYEKKVRNIRTSRVPDVVRSAATAVEGLLPSSHQEHVADSEAGGGARTSDDSVLSAQAQSSTMGGLNSMVKGPHEHSLRFSDKYIANLSRDDVIKRLQNINKISVPSVTDANIATLFQEDDETYPMATCNLSVATVQKGIREAGDYADKLVPMSRFLSNSDSFDTEDLKINLQIIVDIKRMQKWLQQGR